jgi:hypothetical protein
MKREALLIVGICCLLSGCGSKNAAGPDQSGPERVLDEIYSMYRGYSLAHKKGPAAVKDLQASQAAYYEGFRALQTGQYTVIWGVTLKKHPTGTAILAYPKDTPKQGGVVLMTDGDVKQLSAEEFNSAPKAQSGATY